ncbi:MAG: efflux RND transporter periplasmic adaptor subunit [Chloroflexi bacterium]|nr:efflux RND transporter periplasmic adaptor subunit [Chloroflexota bacterium]
MNTKHLSKPIITAIPILTLVLIGVLLSGCGAVQNTGSGSQTADTATPVISNNSLMAGGVIVAGRLEPTDSVWLSFQSAGEVADIQIEEGQSVKTGDILAVLGNPETAQSDLKAAELELTTAQQALDDLNQNARLDESRAYQAFVEAKLAAIDAHQTLSDMDTQSYQDKIDDAWTKVQDEQDNLNDAQDTFDKYNNLDENNTTRQNAQTDLDDAQKVYDDAVRAHDQLVYDLEQAQANADNADQTVNQAKLDYDDRQNGPDPDQLALANAQVDSAQAHVDAAQKTLDLMTLTAPFDGVVTSVDMTIGQTVSPEEPVVRLADFSQWYIETTDLDEIKVARIDPGKPVTLTVDALPDLVLKGTVDRISLDYIEKSGDILYTARIRLDDTDPRLRWGMTISVNFEE